MLASPESLYRSADGETIANRKKDRSWRVYTTPLFYLLQISPSALIPVTAATDVTDTVKQLRC